jgi:hypothetical protein
MEPRQRTFLIDSHQATVAGDVAGEDGGQAPLRSLLGHAVTYV